ncbi:MAG: hypothetical protein RIA63_14445, partial [Cyclobacteriaceae bacterium]
DFVEGRTVDLAVALGPYVFDGGGIIQGYLKGFGFTQFQYRIEVGGQVATALLNASVGAGLLSGKYVKNSGLANPSNFEGPGLTRTFAAADFNGPIFLSLSEWKGFEDIHNEILIWQGSAVGFGITFSGVQTNLQNFIPGSISYIKTKTIPIFPRMSDTTRELFRTYYNK